MYFTNSALEAPQGKAVKGRGKGPNPGGDLCSDSESIIYCLRSLEQAASRPEPLSSMPTLWGSYVIRK